MQAHEGSIPCYAVSTALWTGVYLADILAHVRPERPKAKYVIFEGADELPKGPYGTSQKLSWAADKGRGMLIGTKCLKEYLKHEAHEGR